ncbi:MAG: ABC transporter permease [Anaerolineaceae bacterium]|nr:ABC transporter permease [Anaerolineaceae bacterium]
MKIKKALLEALDSLLANKLRSGLTMLGIIIGVASVIAMLAIGEGANTQITSEIEGIGTNVLFVSSGGDATNPEPLTMNDAEAIANSDRAPSVSGVAPTIQGNFEISIPRETSNTTVVGVTEEYFTIRNVEVSEGVLINQAHLNTKEAVVILGSTTAENLFGSVENLIGESVRINDQPFTVIGIQKEAGGIGGSDNQVLVPLTTARSRLIRKESPGELDLIYVQAASSEEVDLAIEEVANILRAQHISTLGEDDFEVISTASFLEIASSITTTMTLFLGGIAGVSLMVGGIGIMNIMMVSVIERTREIGLRKALGARNLDILVQFMIESSVMSLFGGLIGIAFGWMISAIVGVVADEYLEPVITMGSIWLAVSFSLGVGMFFGIYPASRAAKLEPVEALRSD